MLSSGLPQQPDGDKKLSEGLLQVGDHVQEKKEYNEKKNIFVYEG